MLSIVYWFLALSGGLYIIVSFLIGEIVDFGHNLLDGLGESIEGFLEGALELITGDFIDIEFGGGVDHGIDSGPSPFSLRTIIMFATGFGAGGLLGYGLNLPELLTLIPAFSVGFTMALVTYLFVRYIYRAIGSSDINQDDYVGLSGIVITSIPGDKAGQVSVTVKLRKKNVAAKSKDGTPIPSGTQVYISSMEGGVLVVERA